MCEDEGEKEEEEEERQGGGVYQKGKNGKNERVRTPLLFLSIP